MNTVTIPKEMIQKNDDLVLIPRKEYEALSRARVIAPTVKMTQKEKREWEQAKEEYRRGEYTIIKNREDLGHALGIISKRSG